MRCGSVDGNRFNRDVEASADRFRNRPKGKAFILNGVIARTRRILLNSVAEQARGIVTMDRWPAIGTLADIGRDARPARERD